ncbi:DUF1398 family protein, partial [Escherichia coli]|nr:DUF1398 family protein [Escherichia coli]MDM8871361.1 DUF1398 family protein [Escherichia coli]
MDQVVVFQKMFEQVRKEQNFSWFYSELKHHRIAHYIYYLATDNIRIITHDDTVLLLRGTRNLLKVSTTKNPAKIKEAALGNDSNLLIVFYVQIMPDDLVMQLHR